MGSVGLSLLAAQTPGFYPNQFAKKTASHNFYLVGSLPSKSSSSISSVGAMPFFLLVMAAAW